MTLYIDHVLQTTTDNQVGADFFVAQLVNNNRVILKEQITPNLIESFILRS